MLPHICATYYHLLSTLHPRTSAWLGGGREGGVAVGVGRGGVAVVG